MDNKVLTLLGFASKAGKLSFGMDAAVAAIVTKKALLAVVAGDISDKSKKEISFYSAKNNVRMLILDEYNIKTVSDAVGRKCGIVTVNDSGFAGSLIKAASVIGGNADDQ